MPPTWKIWVRTDAWTRMRREAGRGARGAGSPPLALPSEEADGVGCLTPEQERVALTLTVGTGTLARWPVGSALSRGPCG